MPSSNQPTAILELRMEGDRLLLNGKDVTEFSRTLERGAAQLNLSAAEVFCVLAYLLAEQCIAQDERQPPDADPYALLFLNLFEQALHTCKYMRLMQQAGAVTLDPSKLN